MLLRLEKVASLTNMTARFYLLRYEVKQQLSVAHENSSHLESGKDSLERQLSMRELELEKAKVTIADLEKDINILKDRSHG